MKSKHGLITLEGVGGVVKLVALWISVLQERPPLLPIINSQCCLYQIGDGVFRGHQHLYCAQAVLDGHVE